MHPPREHYERLREAVGGRELPALLVDLDAFDQNAESLTSRAAGLRIRIASKSVRCRALLTRALARPGYGGVLNYSASEAAWLAARDTHGAEDQLVAYPCASRESLEQVAIEVARGKKIVLMVDSVEQLELHDTVARAHGIVLELCIDIDMSSSYPGLWFGVRRSPIRSVQDALALLDAIGRRPNLRVVAAMGYEAQIAGLQDKGSGLQGRLTAPIIATLKARSIREIHERRAAIVVAIEHRVGPLRIVNGGGTGSIESTHQDRSVNECAAGSGLYGPVLFDGYQQFHPAPAMMFALAVTRRPTNDILTCFGGGYIASGAAGPDRLPSPYLPRGAELIDQEGAGEVQTPLHYRGEIALRVGDPIFFRHAKAGEPCERFREILCIRGAAVVDVVPTYRGEDVAFG